MKNFTLPENVIEVLKTLEANGFEGYIVGGCVRDMLLGKTPNDWDITTNALPEQVIEMFPRTVDIGKLHGTIGIIFDDKSHPVGANRIRPQLLSSDGGREDPAPTNNPRIIEVTTYRIDGEYVDNRRPETVTFTPNLADDLARRDFTINAMAVGITRPRRSFCRQKRGKSSPYGRLFLCPKKSDIDSNFSGALHPLNPSQGGLRGDIIDFHGGREDLESGVIRCVGDANTRFQEDALRMLRAIRFSAQLGFSIEFETYNAIRENAKLIQNISAERIRIEFDKILLSDHPERLETIVNTGLGEVFFPEFDLIEFNSKINQNKSKKNQKKLKLMLTKLGDNVLPLLNRLKYDNETKHSVKTLVKYCKLQIEPTKISVKRAIQTVGEENFLDLLDLRSDDKLREIYFDIKQNGEPLHISELAINGQDLMSLGIPAGKEIGVILKRLLDLVLEHPELNKRETLIKKVGEINGRF